MRTLLFALTLAACAAAALAQQDQPAAAAPPASAASAETEPACQGWIESLKSTRVLFRIRMDGNEPRVLMGPGYTMLNADAKIGAAKVISCYLMGSYAESPCADFDLLHWQSGRVLARFEGCRLKVAQ